MNSVFLKKIRKPISYFNQWIKHSRNWRLNLLSIRSFLSTNLGILALFILYIWLRRLNILVRLFNGATKKIRKPKPWKHSQPITKTQLIQLRDEFLGHSPSLWWPERIAKALSSCSASTGDIISTTERLKQEL